MNTILKKYIEDIERDIHLKHLDIERAIRHENQIAHIAGLIDLFKEFEVSVRYNIDWIWITADNIQIPNDIARIRTWLKGQGYEESTQSDTVCEHYMRRSWRYGMKNKATVHLTAIFSEDGEACQRQIVETSMQPVTTYRLVCPGEEDYEYKEVD